MSKRLLFMAVTAMTIVGISVFGNTPVGHAQVFNSSPATTNVQPAGGATSASGAVEQTAWGISMPKITMPKVTLPKVTMPKFGMPNLDSFTAPVKAGFGKVSSGSKQAWEGAKEMLSFGKNKATSTANRAAPKQPSMWQKLTARQPERQVPQTVGEFMSQPRLDP